VTLPPWYAVIHRVALLLYPERFRLRFGEQMQAAFEDLYVETRRQSGQPGAGFWLWLAKDTVRGAAGQHLAAIQEVGVLNHLRQTLHISGYTIGSAVLLLPFLFLFGIDFIGRLVQLDFSHPNRALYTSPFYTLPESGRTDVLWAIVVAAPVAAIALNCIPIAQFLKRSAWRVSPRRLLVCCAPALVVMIGAFGALGVTYGHDVAPCLANHLLANGLNDFGRTLSICRDA
jgi:hypothetical protein